MAVFHRDLKILYLANVRLPTEKAHGIQIMKMCESFSRAGAAVELVVPRRFNSIKSDPFEYYAVERCFAITRLFTIDLVRWGRFGFWIQSLSFAARAVWYGLRAESDIIYSRDEWSLYGLSFGRRRIVWETHAARHPFFQKRLLRCCLAIVAISRGLAEWYLARGGRPERILVAPDGVDLAEFQGSGRREDWRQKLGLPPTDFLAVYTGHLYGWKGVRVLLEAAERFPAGIVAVLVGGTEVDLKALKKSAGQLNNVLILGHKPRHLIPGYLRSADVLVLPNSGREAISRFFTSPLKLFEYMASGRPIVASDLPSLREVLNEQNAVLVEPDDPAALARGIIWVLRHRAESWAKAQKAQSEVARYSWSVRAEKILEFVGNLNCSCGGR